MAAGGTAGRHALQEHPGAAALGRGRTLNTARALLSAFTPRRSELPRFALLCVALGAVTAAIVIWIQDGGPAAGPWEWAAMAGKTALLAVAVGLIARQYMTSIGLRRIKSRIARTMVLIELLEHVSEVKRLALLYELQNAFAEAVKTFDDIGYEDEEIRQGIEAIRERVKILYDATLDHLGNSRDNAGEFAETMEMLGRNVDGSMTKPG